ncbi:hypothetical protein V8C86DRAFT_3149688 [Haematococcus lacustris]
MTQLQSLVMALEDAKIGQQDIYALIVDFTSAFNTTDQDKTLWIMYDLGFPTDAIEAVAAQLHGQIEVQGQATQYLPPTQPFLYLGVNITMTLDWKHQHRRMTDTLRSRLECLRTSYASPRQTLHIVKTAVATCLAYAFPVTPCSPTDLEAWDSMITTMMKRRFGLWVSAPSAMIREDTDTFGLGCTSLAVEYNSRCVKTLLEGLQAEGRYGKLGEEPTSDQLQAIMNHRDINLDLDLKHRQTHHSMGGLTACQWTDKSTYALPGWNWQASIASNQDGALGAGLVFTDVGDLYEDSDTASPIKSKLKRRNLRRALDIDPTTTGRITYPDAVIISPNGPYEGPPSPAQPSPAQPSPAQPSPAQPSPAQPSPAQPSPAQPSPAQPSPAQPSPAQPSPAQPSPAQPSPAQPSPAQPSPAQPSPAQPSPAQPSPAQPSPAQPSPAQPSPAQPSPAQPSPAQPSPAQPSPAQPSPAQPSPAQPSPAQPSPAQPSPAQPSPAQPSPAQPSPAQPSPAQPSPPLPPPPPPPSSPYHKKQVHGAQEQPGAAAMEALPGRYRSGASKE